jgi:alkylation response protein AidB-like acyl-CoA dehydrogenase
MYIVEAIVTAAKGIELFSPLIGLSEDQKQFYNLAREFADTEMRPKANIWDQDSVFPIETYKKTADLGFAGLFIPEDVGGHIVFWIDRLNIYIYCRKRTESNRHGGDNRSIGHRMCRNDGNANL